jgi:hypothetical protein
MNACKCVNKDLILSTIFAWFTQQIKSKLNNMLALALNTFIVVASSRAPPTVPLFVSFIVPHHAAVLVVSPIVVPHGE